MSDDPDTTDLAAPPGAEALPSMRSPLVPRNSISGRALVGVVAIMTFLASLTAGAVMLVRASANDWQADVARELTIQVRPVAGHDVESEVRKAADIARGFPGVAGVKAYSKEESGRLLEPWLGTGLSLDDLPIPRLIVVDLASGAAIDIAGLRKALNVVAGANVDDHRGWIEQMRLMSGTVVIGGITILLLVFAATALSVAFATRGAMASNRPTIEVLHFIGATNQFIAGHFQRHFLLLGLKGGTIGGLAAALFFAIAGLISGLAGGAAVGEVSALFGSFAIGLAGYAVLAIQVILIALLTAGTSGYTVHRTLMSID
ncbi:MAG TPA: ABC transporter permease [Xanthobacteraceae bacterium]|nr:ABC transporter permease [Xanthobacteraceae bacterium]